MTTTQYIVEVQRHIGTHQYTFESFVFDDEEDFKRYLFHSIENFKSNKRTGNMYKYNMPSDPTLMQMVTTFRRKKNLKLKYFTIQKVNQEVIILVH